MKREKTARLTISQAKQLQLEAIETERSTSHKLELGQDLASEADWGERSRNNTCAREFAAAALAVVAPETAWAYIGRKARLAGVSAPRAQALFERAYPRARRTA